MKNKPIRVIGFNEKVARLSYAEFVAAFAWLTPAEIEHYTAKMGIKKVAKKKADSSDPPAESPEAAPNL